MATKVNIVFYADPAEAFMKAILEQGRIGTDSPRAPKARLQEKTRIVAIGPTDGNRQALDNHAVAARRVTQFFAHFSDT